jgi:ABC-2 type transport system permease protein
MRRTLQVLKNSFWLGWENESNWTWRPVYFIYAAVRPFAICLILYFLFRVATDNPAANETFVSVYLGNAFFTIFMAVAGGVSWVIIEDREFYRIIKYVYISPMHFPLYVIGRTLLILLVSIFSLAVIVLFGIFVLGIPVTFSSIHWPMLLGSFALGLISTGAIGIIFAGFVMITARHATLLAEGVGGAFLLICGVIYPVDLLPTVWQYLAKAIPLTYWMEATRRSFSRPAFGQTLAEWSDGGLMLALAISAVIFVLLASWVFTACLNFARRTGRIDQVTHY